jgi:membrane protease YdiL (CAAX protease family)
MPHSHPIARLLTPIVVAAGLWFYMFSPWTAVLTNFWYTMTASALILIFMACWMGDLKTHIREGLHGGKPLRTGLHGEGLHGGKPLRFLLLGIALAAALWGMFWVGDKLSSLMFGFARGQVDSIYGMKTGIQPWIIALLLLFIIGPAEELFWRGFVQQQLSSHWGENWGFVVTTAIYTLIHLWSFNFMLIMAALVCGIVWGGLYRLQPKWLPALVVSHAVWDACVFVVFPI